MSQRVGSVKRFFSSARSMRWAMNIWPPFLFAGIRVRHISADFRVVRIALRKTPFTTNYFRTQYGGTMFSMVDPFPTFMLYRNLGRGYVVWDQRGEIDFVAPGHTALHAELVLTTDRVEEIRAEAAGGQKVLPWFTVELRDRSNVVVARVRKQVYVRRKR